MALNRAVAVAEVEGPRVALGLVDALDLQMRSRVFAARSEELVERLAASFRQ